MLLAPSVAALFKWRQFEPEMILLAVGWYLRFSLSYRDVEELLAERGAHADHVTVWRWVQCYAPEMERCLRSKLKPTNDSWRVDETYILGQVALPLSSSSFSISLRNPINTCFAGFLYFICSHTLCYIILDLSMF